MSRCLLGSTRQVQGRYGDGVGVDVDGLLQLTDTEVSRNEGAGIDFVGGAGVVRGGGFFQNTIGLVLAEGSDPRVFSTADEVPLANVLWVSEATAFIDNQSRLGAGALPLPPPFTTAVGYTP
jgi:hypothetical protein